MSKLLILTLYSGEKEYPYCRKSIEAQDYRPFDHVEIAGLGNYEAHQKLYQTIHERSGEFDYFLKLDADMIFRSEDSLARMVAEVTAVKNCDAASWCVLDFLSETRLWGVHLFSNRARWPMPLPKVLVDPVPEIPGVYANFAKNHACHVMHAPFPSKEQAFQFGLHRGMKCFAPLVPGTNWMRRNFQLQLLSAVWRMFLRTRDETRGMAMLGAEWARTHPDVIENYKNNPQATRYFETGKNLTFAEIYARCGAYWQWSRTGDRARFWCGLKAEQMKAKIFGRA